MLEIIGGVGLVLAIVFTLWRIQAMQQKALVERVEKLEKAGSECVADQRAAAIARAELEGKMDHIRADVSTALAQKG